MTGEIEVVGIIENVDTSAFNEGDVLAASPEKRGEFAVIATLIPDENATVSQCKAFASKFLKRWDR